MKFDNLNKLDARTYTFTLSPISVSYANTLRRIILTGVETVAFRADMTSTGTTTDVVVKRNDTPMTNEMLAHRIGLLPINVPEPLKWKDDEYTFSLKVAGDKDSTVFVTSGDFKVTKSIATEDEPVLIPTDTFFPASPITGDTCLIATLQPGTGDKQQFIEIAAKATKGTGRENARFCPVSQCSYEYTVDNNPVRIEEMFKKWLIVAKKVTSELDKGGQRYQELRREYNTMQIKRCYKVDDKNEPYSFDFTVESSGVLPVPYIIERACEVGQNMCSRYVNIHQGDIPDEITISPCDTQLIGYDFLIRGHDHTLGNLLQTWLVDNNINGNATPKITFAGYKHPHPLRDEIVLRIGVEDGEESTARQAFATAAKGCVDMFQTLRSEWRSALGVPDLPTSPPSRGIRRKPVIATASTTKTS